MKNFKKVAGLAILVSFLCFTAYEYYNKYFYFFKSPAQVKSYILSFGALSVLAFIAMQILQVVAFFIPGEIIQIAGGYIYGTFRGGLLSTVGITLGSIAVFYIARVLGRDFVKEHIQKRKNTFIERALEGNRERYIIFFMYLVPGIPKDIIGYICGVLDIKFSDYIIFSTIGRLPGIFISAYFGYKLFSRDIAALAFVGIAMTALFILGVLKGEKILSFLKRK